MPRRRIPKELAEIKGSAKRNPARFAQRSGPTTAPLGPVSDWLTIPRQPLKLRSAGIPADHASADAGGGCAWSPL
jgi:hypothetical protein